MSTILLDWHSFRTFFRSVCPRTKFSRTPMVTVVSFDRLRIFTWVVNTILSTNMWPSHGLGSSCGRIRVISLPPEWLWAAVNKHLKGNLDACVTKLESIAHDQKDLVQNVSNLIELYNVWTMDHCKYDSDLNFTYEK